MRVINKKILYNTIEIYKKHLKNSQEYNIIEEIFIEEKGFLYYELRTPVFR